MRLLCVQGCLILPFLPLARFHILYFLFPYFVHPTFFWDSSEMRASFAFAALLALLPSAFATDYNVEVGPNGQLAFSPPFVHARRGDIVRFHL